MRLPPEETERLARFWFGRREELLRALEGTPSPAYLLEPEVLRERARRFRRTFEARLEDCAFYYALKCNDRPEVARILLEAGYGLDVSGGRELDLALRLGAEDLIFSGPGKTGEELALAAEHSRRVTVLLDGFGELERLDRAAAAGDTEIRAGVRLSTDPSGLWGKFGIPPESLPAFLREARRHPRVRLSGLQFHTSWNRSPRAQLDFLRILEPILAAVPPEELPRLEFLDVGGGYWPEWGEWLREEPAAGSPSEDSSPADPSPLDHRLLPAAPLEDYAEALAGAIPRSLGRLWPCGVRFEPGRWICDPALHLRLTVVDRKGPDLAIVDGGINAIGWDRFETDYCPILNLTRPSLRERPFRILGSLCTPHDLFGLSCFGEDLLPGDALLIPRQGAYTLSLAQSFIKGVPPVVELPPEGPRSDVPRRLRPSAGPPPSTSTGNAPPREGRRPFGAESLGNQKDTFRP
jgi:diaminopimelate decarboxylase